MHFKPHVEKVISIISNYTVSQMVSGYPCERFRNPASATTTPQRRTGKYKTRWTQTGGREVTLYQLPILEGPKPQPQSNSLDATSVGSSAFNASGLDPQSSQADTPGGQKHTSSHPPLNTSIPTYTRLTSLHTWHRAHQ
jgi:hypothetical protein